MGRFILCGVVAVLVLCGCGKEGPGGPCNSDKNCEKGLACYNDFCSGTGIVLPGSSCDGSVDCTPGSICWSEICVGVGALRFSLVWTEDTDFDLHVRLPDGTEIDYGNPSGGGATLDVDDCIDGSCANPDGAHVENVFFDSAPSGAYEYWVDNYDCVISGSYTIEVFIGAEVADSNSGTLAADCIESAHYLFEI